MTPTDANAPESTPDVPPGLQAHAETRLRNAYAHAAAARRRELDAARASSDPSAFAADPASDADARDPPDPTEGIAATIDALKTLARREVAEAAVQARGADDHRDDDEAQPKRPRMTSPASGPSDPPGPSDPSGPSEPPSASSPPAKGEKRRRAPNVAARFDASARSMATAMRASWPLTRALVLTREATVDVAVEASKTHARRAAWRREVITTHHKTLRKNIARKGGRDDAKGMGIEAKGEDAEATRDVADTTTTTTTSAAVVSEERLWRAATGGEDARSADALSAYAEAAEEVGNRTWVIAALLWCHAEIRAFLREGGAAEAATKSARTAHWRERGARMPEAEEAALREAFEKTLNLETGALVPSEWRGADRDRPLLVDVGSCWDFFRRFDASFRVVALDLCPRRDEVLTCDFLGLRIGAPDEDIVTAPVDPGGIGARRLESLPAGAANAAVLSLVLSYVPTPRQRGEMIRRCREILADDGRGILCIVTPHSTDRGHVPHRALPVLREWRAAIESVGFERVRYERHPSVHCLAYRTVGKGGARCAEGEAPPMRIAFDHEADQGEDFEGAVKD